LHAKIPEDRKRIGIDGKNQLTHKVARLNQNIQKMSAEHTFTICGAAASADMPRQQSRTISAVRASQTPSLLMISLPPEVESYINRNKGENKELEQLR
jgi:hypothetical protein